MNHTEPGASDGHLPFDRALYPDAGHVQWTPTFRNTNGGAPKLMLSLAISDYDHVRDLVEGHVQAGGLELIHLKLAVEEIFYRFTRFREWEVSEMSMGRFAALLSQGDRSLVGIPVFPSRVFRHSSIYLRRDAGIGEPADLAGRRIGLPEWAQTASIYTRGFLVNQFGLNLEDIDWVQAGVNQPGRHEEVKLALPAGIRLSRHPDACLNQMLLDGEIDAIVSAHPPQAFKDGNPAVTRLFDDYRSVEETYWRESGIFPIMHVIVIRAAVLERFPWVATNLITAFEEAKRRSLSRLQEMTASRYPVPWIQNVALETMEQFGTDSWPYGVDRNLPTLETFLKYAHEQGVCQRHVAVDELFPPTVRSSYSI